MEATTPFDLNQAIQRWRENLGQSPAFRSENLFELESHLRDSVAGLQRKGLSDEEALLVATKRLGPPATLETEFAKQNVQLVWLDRALWVLVGMQLLTLANGTSNVIGLLSYLSLPSLNSWLSAYGFTQIPTAVLPLMAQVVVLPIVLLSGAKLAMSGYRWFQKKGMSPVIYLQQRPKLLTGFFALLCVLPFVVSWVSAWIVGFYGPQRVYGPGIPVGWMYGVQALRVIMFSVFVLIIARKRLHLLCRS